MTRQAELAKVFRLAPRYVVAPPDPEGPQRPAHHFLTGEGGATRVEYGMMVALIAIVVMGALYMLGGTISVKLNQVATCLTTRVC